MQTKPAVIEYPIHTLLAERWSPRAFDSQRPVEPEKLSAVLEAARWAPSCFNDQPWRFIVFNRFADAASWENAASLLTERNQLWARNAPVLILVCTNSKFGHNDTDNRFSQYDAGAASMSICVQAAALELFVHQMGGFDVNAARDVFGIPDSVTPMAIMALGYQGLIEDLNETFVEQEQAARTRKPVEDVVFEGGWNQTPA